MIAIRRFCSFTANTNCALPIPSLATKWRVEMHLARAVRSYPVDTYRHKESPIRLDGACVRITYLPGQAKYCHAAAIVRWTIAGIKKTPSAWMGLVFALPIFPGSHPPSIVGAHELNFCVRDGNRWTLMAINTNYISASISALHLLVTRTGFEPMLTA